MQSDYYNFTQMIMNLFQALTDFFTPLGIPFGPIAWFYILSVGPLFLIVVALVLRGRRSSGGSSVDEGIRRIIASTGDISAGMAGAKKLKFVKTPADALVFLKVEENAIQQALSALDYYLQQGDISEHMKSRIAEVYEQRLSAVRKAIAKDEELKEIVDTSSAVDRARSDYLKKLAAMSGTAVETEAEEVGPASVGMPSSVSTTPSSSGAPSGGPPGGGAPSGGPPGGGAPSGGPPGGGAPSGGPPGGGAPSGGPPGGGAPSGGPPGGAPTTIPSTSSAQPTGGVPPGGSAPTPAAPPGGVASSPRASKPASGKSSLQSEMLAEMERLKALMGGD
ncbi:MAG: hypothetical protein ACTSV3_07805 [Candidatus Thorarchaeota archaeon]